MDVLRITWMGSILCSELAHFYGQSLLSHRPIPRWSEGFQLLRWTEAPAWVYSSIIEQLLQLSSLSPEWRCDYGNWHGHPCPFMGYFCYNVFPLNSFWCVLMIAVVVLPALVHKSQKCNYFSCQIHSVLTFAWSIILLTVSGFRIFGDSILFT